MMTNISFFYNRYFISGILIFFSTVFLPGCEKHSLSVTGDVPVGAGGDVSKYEKVYYITNSGNDETGDGSKEQPWKTLTYAASKVSGSNTAIYLNEGIYDIDATVSVKEGVSLLGAGRHKVTLTSSSLAGTGYVIPLVKLSSESIVDGNQTVAGISFNGNNCAVPGGLTINGRNRVTVKDCDFRNFSLNGVLFEAWNLNGWIEGCVFSNNTMENCSGFSSRGYYTGALIADHVRNFEVAGNTIIENGKNNTQGWPVKFWWYNSGYVQNCKFHDNYIFKKYRSSGDAYGGNYTITVEMENCSGMEIYDNEILGTVDMNNIIKGDYEYGAHIHDNIIGYPDDMVAEDQLHSAAIFIEQEANSIIIERNEMRNCYGILRFFPRNLGLHNIIFRYNLCRDIYAGELGDVIRIQESGADPKKGLQYGGVPLEITDFKIYNNTFVPFANQKNMYFGFMGEKNRGFKFKASNFRIDNNIWVGFLYSWASVHDFTSITGFSMQNNLSYQCGTDGKPKVNSADASIDAQPSGNISGNPQFESSSSYKIQKKSPAVNAGISLSTDIEGFSKKCTDIEGHAIPASGVDIGCYEL